MTGVQTCALPILLVVGDRDMENNTVSVRLRNGEDLGAMSMEQFMERLGDKVSTKALDL